MTQAKPGNFMSKDIPFKLSNRQFTFDLTDTLPTEFESESSQYLSIKVMMKDAKYCFRNIAIDNTKTYDLTSYFADPYSVSLKAHRLLELMTQHIHNTFLTKLSYSLLGKFIVGLINDMDYRLHMVKYKDNTISNELTTFILTHGDRADVINIAENTESDISIKLDQLDIEKVLKSINGVNYFYVYNLELGKRSDNSIRTLDIDKWHVISQDYINNYLCGIQCYGKIYFSRTKQSVDLFTNERCTTEFELVEIPQIPKCIVGNIHTEIEFLTRLINAAEDVLPFRNLGQISAAFYSAVSNVMKITRPILGRFDTFAIMNQKQDDNGNLIGTSKNMWYVLTSRQMQIIQQELSIHQLLAEDIYSSYLTNNQQHNGNEVIVRTINFQLKNIDGVSRFVISQYCAALPG